jgi:hypothetical protein
VIEQEGEVNSKEKGMDNDGDGAEMGMADIWCGGYRLCFLSNY